LRKRKRAKGGDRKKKKSRDPETTRMKEIVGQNAKRTRLLGTG